MVSILSHFSLTELQAVTGLSGTDERKGVCVYKDRNVKNNNNKYPQRSVEVSIWGMRKCYARIFMAASEIWLMPVHNSAQNM